jgi:hypothetical protein
MLASTPAQTLNPIRSRRGTPRFSLFGKCSNVEIGPVLKPPAVLFSPPNTPPADGDVVVVELRPRTTHFNLKPISQICASNSWGPAISAAGQARPFAKRQTVSPVHSSLPICAELIGGHSEAWRPQLGIQPSTYPPLTSEGSSSCVLSKQVDGSRDPHQLERAEPCVAFARDETIIDITSGRLVEDGVRSA